MPAHRSARLFLFALPLAIAAPVSAQSLNPKAPTPLVAGENRGTVDTMVGPQYWSFKYVAGKGTISVRFTSMALFGNPMTATIEVVLHGNDGKVLGSRPLTSNGRVAELNWPGTFASPGTSVIELRPAGNTLVRSGGDYSITVSGDAINYAGVHAAGPEQIVGTYSVMVCPPDFDCQSSLAIRFQRDGTVVTTDGHHGTWKVFDPDALIYSVVVGRDRWSLKLVPGRGLFGPNDLSVVVFQSVR
jgi:hypothetical protein